MARVRVAPRRAVVVAVALLALGPTSPVAALAAPGTVYVSNRSTADLSAFALALDGTPSLLGTPVKTGGTAADGVAVTPDGRHAYVTDFGSGDLARFDIAPDGTLAHVGTPVKTGGSFPLGVAITPDGRHAYVADLGSSDVSRFDIALDGTLTHAGTPVSISGGPEGVAVTPDGRHAYVTGNTTSDLARLDIAPDGGLTKVGTRVTTGGSGPEGVALTPDGRHAYVVDNISRDLSRFDIAPDGTLTHVGAPVKTGGVDPQDVAVTPDGRHAYVTDNGSSDLSRFDIAPDGTLTHVAAVAALPIGSGPEGVAVTPDGRHAYAANDDTSDLARFDIASDGSLTQVGPLLATGGLNAGEFFSVAARPDQGPVAALAPTVAPARQLSSFDASGSFDSDGQVVRYDWDLGDGTTLTNAGPTVSHTYSAAGDYSVSVTVTDDGGCSTVQVFTGQTVGCNGTPAAQRTTTITVRAATPAPLPAPTPAIPAPTLPSAVSVDHISQLTVRPSTFAAAAKGPPVVAAGRRKTGTLVSYTGTQPAATTFSVQRPAAGRRSGRSCVAPTGRNAQRKRCSRYLNVGNFVHADTAGANQFRFSGRVNGLKLRTGRYRLQAKPRNTAGSGPAAYQHFRVKR